MLGISSVIIHPAYDDTTSSNDVAIVELDSDAPVDPIKLNFGAAPATGTSLTIIGTGVTQISDGLTTGSTVVQKLVADVVDTFVCLNDYGLTDENAGPFICTKKDGSGIW